MSAEATGFLFEGLKERRPERNCTSGDALPPAIAQDDLVDSVGRANGGRGRDRQSAGDHSVAVSGRRSISRAEHSPARRFSCREATYVLNRSADYGKESAGEMHHSIPVLAIFERYVVI